MEHRALAALLIRLVGLWELVTALNALPNSVGYFAGGDYVRTWGFGTTVLLATVSVGFPLVLGLLLLYFPRTIAARVLRIEGIEPESTAEAGLLERVAIWIMGLWFTAQGCLDAMHALSKWYFQRRYFEEQYPGTTTTFFTPESAANLVVAVLQLVVGLWMLLGSRGLASALQKLRH